ncbi:NUAK family SNF1-like kinase 1 [Clupea harengus]|uniref:non-specific serine/threonine protein kinase n=1 Tax=Clupea harengus TaxID=7950 RepID=A0A6P8GM20_CLUHA|nr:NUAK family SNF1-like kinase 1 [Clupea harengus]
METVSVLQQQLSHPGTMTDQHSSEHCAEDVLLPVDYPAGEVPPSGRRGSSVKKHLHKHNLKHRYELKETLGRGTYGKVKKAIERHTGRVVAIKSIRKEKIRDEQDMVHIRREIEIMSSLRHPHIISIHEVFENKDKIVIVMEYASKGELYEYISERRRLSERETRHFFRQIVSAVHFCHKNGIVHRDLKLENVLLDENCNIKIADFGLSNLYHKDTLLNTFCGSPLYASPEIVNGRPYKGPEVDSWALGVLLYTLVYGTMPFDGGDHRILIRQISNGEYREPTQSSDARGLIRWMLMVNPERRATVEDIANHWWVNWGWKSTVCDCDVQRGDLPGSSPMLARFIDWQNRADGRSVAKAPRGSEPASGADAGPARQRLRRSSKENDAGVGVGVRTGGHVTLEDQPGLKRPKGILKTRVSGDHRSQSLGELELRRSLQYQDVTSAPGPEEDAEEHGHGRFFLSGSLAKMVPTLPKKGILKNNQQRESGYYSSPERSESSELLGGATMPPPPAPTGSPTRRAVGRKGILKRNGKYSTHNSSSAQLSAGIHGDPSTSDSGLSRSQSRPSSIVDEETGLSCAPFMGMDWPPASPKPNIRACMSAEDLLPLAGFRGLQTAPALHGGKMTRSPPGSPGDNGSFSLLGDLDDMTQVYQLALDISSTLT